MESSKIFTIFAGVNGVSEATIEHRYETSAENFLKIYDLCDQINIYDNSGEYLVLAAYTVCGKLQKTNVDIAWVKENMNSVKAGKIIYIKRRDSSRRFYMRLI